MAQEPLANDPSSSFSGANSATADDVNNNVVAAVNNNQEEEEEGNKNESPKYDEQLSNKGDTAAEQKDTGSEAKTSSARYYNDIYGRVPGKEPKYNIPCPSE